MPPTALHSTLVDACHAAGTPRLAVVFGSVARGTARADSDLDLAIDLGRPLTVEDKMRLIDALAAASGRPVDLVDLRRAGVPLIGEILASGVRLIGDIAAHGALTSRHLTDVADFLPASQRVIDQRLAALTGQRPCPRRGLGP
jgi:predicted nucleotidyltransferase